MTENDANRTVVRKSNWLKNVAEMSMLWNLQMAYKDLVEKTGGPIVDFGITLYPIAPLFLLALLGLFLTIVLLFDEVRHKNVEN